MKIVQINAVYGSLSTGRTAKQLHDFLKEKGHECVTFYGNNYSKNFSPEEAIFMGSYLSHKMHAFSGRLLGEVGMGSWFSTDKLLRFIKKYKPDVVHLRNLHGNFVHIPKLLQFLAQENIPTVVQLHDCYFYTGGCMHYTSNKCNLWQSDCKGCNHLLRGKNFIFFNRADRNLKIKKKLFEAIQRIAVLGVSKWTAEEAAKSTVFKNIPIIDFVYNWIDLNIFRPLNESTKSQVRERLRISPEKKIILGVASGWGINKGLSDYVQLRKILPIEYVIVLVGKIPDNYKLPNGILNIETISSQERLAEMYNIADVFVHLSKEETFGKVTAEALACGTPAVVYNSTANPELVDENTGCVVEPGDILGIKNAITSLDKSEVSINCRERASDLFNLNTNCAKILDIYSKLHNA